MELTERKRQILKVVVEDYIRSAEPVGSKTIAARMGGSVSSATIRNELADLVELGYLEERHITGSFGSNTRRAVADFQTQQMEGKASTGIADRQTQQALEKAIHDRQLQLPDTWLVTE